MAEEYDPSAPDQHAQFLFDNWKSGDLGDLYAWLSSYNIDANITPHSEITTMYEADYGDDE